MAISASATFEGEWTLQTSASTTIGLDFNQIIDWTSIFACGYFETAEDYKSFVNELHTEEYRKDIFREASINPITTEHRQRVTNYCMPAKRNFRGRQSSRI